MAKLGMVSWNVPSIQGRSTSLLLIVVMLGALLVGGSFFSLLVGTGAASPARPAVGHLPAAQAPRTFLGYNVSFTQSGLPRGTAWTVTFNGTVYNAGRRGITIPEVPNGTYAWNTSAYAGLYPTPAFGSITVTGAAFPQTITFAPPPGRYSVTFTETGLPFGTAWGVTFNGTYYVNGFAGGGTTVTVNNAVNGTYTWNTSSFAGLYPTPPSGTLTVNGGPQNQAITFATLPGHYSVTFTETGLPFGTAWGVTFNGTYYVNGFAGGGTTVTVNNAVNGTYTWNTSSFAGLYPTPPSGSLTVAGAAAAQGITFAALPGHYSVTFSQTGLTFNMWSVTFNGSLYTATFGGNIVINNVVNNTYAWNVTAIPGFTAAPPSGSLTVNGAAATQAIAFTALNNTYAVTFTETGLPAGSTWSVHLNGSTYSSAGSAFINPGSFPNGTYLFSVVAYAGYLANPPSGTLNISGASPPITRIAFTAIPPGMYSVTFQETGLALTTSWSVTFNGSVLSGASTTLLFTSKNGTWPFSVASVAGYSASPSTGSVPVNGAPITEMITFYQGQPRFGVTFTESGLPANTNWSLTFNGTPYSGPLGGNVVISGMLNGTYPFTVATLGRWTPSPPTGNLVVRGSAVSQAINFTLAPMTYGVTFTATGLPSGDMWSVILNGSTQSAAGASIVFNVPNYTYAFSVGTVTGFKATPSSGKITVSGGAASQVIIFTALAPFYTVSFSETGLPAASSWTVTLNGTPLSTTSSPITFSMRNGTYSYKITGPSGYSASPSSGSLTVSGKTIAQSVAFSSTSSGNGSKSTLGTLGTYWILWVAVAIVLVALVAILLLRRRPTSAAPAVSEDRAPPGMKPWSPEGEKSHDPGSQGGSETSTPPTEEATHEATGEGAPVSPPAEDAGASTPPPDEPEATTPPSGEESPAPSEESTSPPAEPEPHVEDSPK